MPWQIDAACPRPWANKETRLSHSSTAPSPLKGFVKRSLARFGYHLERFPRTNTLDAHLLRLLTALQINCVVDVGAHRGEYGLQLRALGYRGRIVSFEPVAANYAVLAQCCARDSHWQAHQLALGAEEGSKEINVFDGSTFNSFLTPSGYGHASFASKLRLERTETVTVKRLDSGFDRCVAGLAEPRVLLKMDTQGYDLIVLEGAGSRLGSILAVQTELSVQPLYQGISTDFTTALHAFRERGFDLSGLYPVNWDPRDQLRLVEMDCLLCRPISQNHE
jgi:FkbM family methyltransferase